MDNISSQPEKTKSPLSRLFGKTYSSGSAWVVGSMIAMVAAGADLSIYLSNNIAYRKTQFDRNRATAKAQWEPKHNEAQKYFKYYTHSKDFSVWENLQGRASTVTGPNEIIEEMAANIEQKTGYPVNTHQDIAGSEFTDMTLSSLKDNIQATVRELPFDTTKKPSGFQKLTNFFTKKTPVTKQTTQKILIAVGVLLIPLVGRGTIKGVKILDKIMYR